MNYSELDFKDLIVKRNSLRKVLLKDNSIIINKGSINSVLWLMCKYCFAIDAHFNYDLTFVVRLFIFDEDKQTTIDNGYVFRNAFQFIPTNIEDGLLKIQELINYNYKYYKTLKAFT